MIVYVVWLEHEIMSSIYGVYSKEKPAKKQYDLLVNDPKTFERVNLEPFYLDKGLTDEGVRNKCGDRRVRDRLHLLGLRLSQSLQEWLR